MLDIKFLRTNPDIVKQNIKNKFQDEKLPLVDKVIELDKEFRESKTRAEALRANREIRKIMLVIPNIIDPSVPIGKDDSENVEIEKFGEPFVPDFEVPYHVDIMEKLDGIELDQARETSGNGFYYLKGDIARLHSACLSYARDFMIDRGFTYYIPPYMIRSSVVTGVMSFAEMENMMYKIEGEDLYLIGTSEHSMIGKFIDTITDEDKVSSSTRSQMRTSSLRHLHPTLPASVRKSVLTASRSVVFTGSTSSKSRK